MDPKVDHQEGPFTAADILPDQGYELYHGHPVRCLPTGGDGATTTAVGLQAIASDPDAEEAGVDPGYVLGTQNVLAPDIAVGNVPDRRGFIQGVPALAIEYAGERQDEVRLQDKIVQFLAGGTRWVWVVRLIGPRRVEVYAPGAGVAVLGPGQVLHAPGVLRNEIPVEALFDRKRAREIALRNLLEDAGYSGLAAVREEGREEAREDGRSQGLRDAVRTLLATRGIALDPAAQARVAAEHNPEQLLLWITRAASAREASEVFETPTAG